QCPGGRTGGARRLLGRSGLEGSLFLTQLDGPAIRVRRRARERQPLYAANGRGWERGVFRWPGTTGTTVDYPGGDTGKGASDLDTRSPRQAWHGEPLGAGRPTHSVRKRRGC